jgi:hypothetical protein
MIAEVVEKPKRELGLKAMQLAARDLIVEQPREQAKLERDLPERLRSVPPAQRLAQPALVFSAPVRQPSIPLRDQSEYEQCLCSCRSNCKS